MSRSKWLIAEGITVVGLLTIVSLVVGGALIINDHPWANLAGGAILVLLAGFWAILAYRLVVRP